MEQNVIKKERGTPILDAAKEAIKKATDKKSKIRLIYGDVEIEVSPTTKPEYVVNAFFAKAASLPNMGMQQPKQKSMGM